MQGAVETLEREMLAAFTDRPDHVIVWKMDNGFFRGLLHGICQYHNLRSCSMPPGVGPTLSGFLISHMSAALPCEG
jgi:hypothetical protein